MQSALRQRRDPELLEQLRSTERRFTVLGIAPHAQPGRSRTSCSGKCDSRWHEARQCTTDGMTAGSAETGRQLQYEVRCPRHRAPHRHQHSCNRSEPNVSVPVLSMISEVVSASSSRNAEPRIRMP